MEGCDKSSQVQENERTASVAITLGSQGPRMHGAHTHAVRSLAITCLNPMEPEATLMWPTLSDYQSGRFIRSDNDSDLFFRYVVISTCIHKTQIASNR